MMILRLIFSLLVILLLGGCGPSGDSVVLYTSQDQVYASEIIADFTRETGMTVLPLYDSESVKTTGLVNRLLAEKARPRCDVFWSNEEIMMRRLAAKNVVAEEEIQTFGYRSRQLVVNTNRVAMSEVPESLEALTNPVWRRRVALAYPLYGTTVTHFMALREAWGGERWEDWCRRLLANEPFVLDGNSTVVRMVGAGEAWLGLTDSDDVLVGQRNGLPVIGISIPAEFPVIANSVGLIQGAPNPEAGRKLMQYLQRPETVAKLVLRGALQGEDPNQVAHQEVVWSAVVSEFDEAFEWLAEVFLR